MQIKRVINIFLASGAIALCGGCHWLSDAPEARAKAYVEAMILDPENIEKLRAASNSDPKQDPRSLIADMPSQLAIRYLHAKHRQGAVLLFAIGRVTRNNRNHRVVRIVAKEGGEKWAEVGPVPFTVELDKDARGRWRIIAASLVDS